MLPISVCMIAKNEEKYIGECLRRLACYDWEIVVVDTGSTDRTVEIARSFTPNVYHFDWINDFSAARNYSISVAKNDYILVVDCDEYLLQNENTNHMIADLVNRINEKQVGMVHHLAPSGENTDNDFSPENASDFDTTNTDIPVVHENIARFFNRKYVHYQGSIHEQLAAIDGQNMEFIPLTLTFYHVGYSTMEIRREKAARNISMLEAELSTHGADPYVLFQLGQSYFGLSDYAGALPYFEQSLALDVNEQEEYVQTLVESYCYCLLYLKQFSRALELDGLYSIFSKRADFVFLMGLIYMNNAMFDKAVEAFLHATSIADYSVEGVNSYKAYYNVGIIYECMGNMELAVSYYKKCGNYGPALERY